MGDPRKFLLVGPKRSGGGSLTVATFGILGDLAVGEDVTPWVEIGPTGYKFRFREARVVLKDSPGGTGEFVEVDLLYSVDDGDTWATIFPTDGTLIVSAGDRKPVVPATVFDTPELFAGALMRADVLAVGADTPGADATVELFGDLVAA